MDQCFVRSNTRSRDRLVALVADLDEAFLQQEVADGWTIAATLAHVTFWDRPRRLPTLDTPSIGYRVARVTVADVNPNRPPRSSPRVPQGASPWTATPSTASPALFPASRRVGMRSRQRLARASPHPSPGWAAPGSRPRRNGSGGAASRERDAAASTSAATSLVRPGARHLTPFSVQGSRSVVVAAVGRRAPVATRPLATPSKIRLTARTRSVIARAASRCIVGNSRTVSSAVRRKTRRRR